MKEWMEESPRARAGELPHGEGHGQEDGNHKINCQRFLSQDIDLAETMDMKRLRVKTVC